MDLLKQNNNIANMIHDAALRLEEEHGFLVRTIIELALKGLSNMYDKEKRLFYYKLRGTFDGIVKEGLSRRYTIISLLGLHRLEAQGVQSPIDIQTTLAALLEKIEEIDNIGDLGLLMWLCSLASPDQLDKIFSDLDIKGALNRFPDARQGKTTELAWFLAGLSHSALASSQRLGYLKDLAIQTFELLKKNYGGKGIFGHLKKTTFKGMIRGRIGCFADQVYPIYALSKYAQAYNNKEAIVIAAECGKKICEHQGRYGQWWWHYDSVTGRVVGRYPVFSVHQDGMAPMAILTLGKITGLDFSKHIYKGLEWITGKNELGFNLVDASQNVIWRSFYRKRYKMYFEEILALAQVVNSKAEGKDLTLLFECRPYHLGWLLYAFADKYTESQIKS